MNRFLILLAAACCVLTATAQKRAMQIDDCRKWRTVRDAKVSPDAQWTLYTYGALYDESQERPATYLFNARSRKTECFEGLSDAQFLSSRWLKYTLSTPADSLGNSTEQVWLMDLTKNKRRQWQGSTPYFVMTPMRDVVSYTCTKPDSDVRQLCLHNLLTDKQTLIDSVDTFSLLDDRGRLFYSTGHTLRLREADGRERVLFSTGGVIGASQFDGEQGTFTLASDESKRFDPEALYAFDATGNSRKIFDFGFTEGLPEGLKVMASPYCPINGGRMLLVDLEEAQRQAPQQREKLDAGFRLEVWTWDEPLSHRRQRPSRGGFNPMQAPRFAYDIAAQRFVQLAPGGIERFATPQCSDFDYLFYCVSSPYLTEFDWRHEQRCDVYRVRVADGHCEPLVAGVREMPEWSADGRHALLYDSQARRWNLIMLATGELIDISSQIGYPVYNELHDMPKAPAAYGIAWWEPEAVVLYDRYDLWRVDFSQNNRAECLTAGYGRQHGVQLRVQERRGDRVYLSGFDTQTKGAGLYLLEKGRVRRLTPETPQGFSVTALSDDGTACVWSRSSFTEYGDLHWSRTDDFAHEVRITDANPCQGEFRWGTARLERWTNGAGKLNEGILYLPDDYVPGKSCPLIVTFYERHTDELFHYRLPEYSSSVIDVPTYVSNGYAVFMPDVAYTVGAPAQSCYDAVVSGVEHLIAQGVAARGCIGLIGHSWGGYQVADLVTRTDLFCCAVPGAAVTNLTSSYLALRGRTGLPRLYVYEDAQGRLGKTLWEDRQMYIDNSPIFRADNIHTPLLIFHNENDDAVPFAQGLDLYFAMRRLGRPAWLLNYRTEGHALNSVESCRDWCVRMQQFFGHYMLGKPMPRWMQEGISVDDEDYDLRLDE